MQHGFVVVCLLFPADQQTPETIEPRVASLDDPSSRALPGVVSQVDGFLTARPNVRGVAAALEELASVGVVVPLVSAEMLPATPGLRTETAHGVTIKRAGDESLVMCVGSGDRQGQRNAASIRKKGTLRAELASVRRIGPGFFPLRAVPSSSLRPGSASPSRSLRARHTLSALPSRAEKTRPSWSIPESSRAACSASQTREERPSIGSRSSARKGCHRALDVDQLEDAHPACSRGTSEATARSDPTAHPERARAALTSCAWPKKFPLPGGSPEEWEFTARNITLGGFRIGS